MGECDSGGRFSVKFYVARISFLPSVQKRLVKHEIDMPPIDLLAKLLVDNVEYVPKNKNYGIDLLFGNFILSEPDNQLLAFKLGRSRAIEVSKYDYDYNKKEFLEISDTTQPNVLVLWDSDQQVILVERNTSVFPKYETVFKSIEYHFNNLVGSYELIVSVVPLTEEMEFWKFINMYRDIYRINFQLIAPNFFGNTQKSVKDILDAVKEEYNAPELSTQIANPMGGIKVSDSDTKIISLLNWIKEGGGRWLIDVMGKRGKKVTIKSSQNAKLVESSIDIENYTAEEAIAILELVKKEYRISDDQRSKHDE